MKFLLRIWRQPNAKSPGKLVDYEVRDISPNTSFLEMLDILNEQLLDRGEEPIAFDSDFRQCSEVGTDVCASTVDVGRRFRIRGMKFFGRVDRQQTGAAAEPEK